MPAIDRDPAKLIDLATIPEPELLALRLSELPVRIEGTWLESRIAQLHDELAARIVRDPIDVAVPALVEELLARH